MTPAFTHAVQQILARIPVAAHLATYLGKCTVGEVRAWAKTQRMHAQFAERLVSNCKSNEIVGEIWKGKEAEVEELYANMAAQYAA
jgi:hypothetical protein